MGLSNAERQARWRERRQQQTSQRIAELEQHIAKLNGGAPLRNDLSEVAALKKELAQAKARIAELEKAGAATDAELRDALLGKNRFAPQATKPKVAKPPLPPDEVRDRQIKGLKTMVHNLTAQLHAVREWSRSAADSGMSFATMSAIAKCLHPDQKPSEAQRAEACKLFTAWKADKDKMRRKAR